MVRPFVVAAAAYRVEALQNWDRYVAKISSWVGEAAQAQARLAVFPEYGAMELASLDPPTMGDLQGSIEFVSSLLPQVDALHSELAARHQMHILAASAPWEASDGSFRNRARLFAPSGAVGVQDKLIMTRFEREEWTITGGGGLSVFETDIGTIGIAVCYDAEFPLIARALIEAGADILLVPSCTDSLAGYSRVKVGARARALEGQCFVVQSPTVGEAPWSPAIDINCGAAGIFGPPDKGFPDNGVLARGELGTPGWTFATIDLEQVARVRREGSVLNFAHWAEQPGIGGGFSVARVRL